MSWCAANGPRCSVEQLMCSVVCATVCFPAVRMASPLGPLPGSTKVTAPENRRESHAGSPRCIKYKPCHCWPVLKMSRNAPGPVNAGLTQPNPTQPIQPGRVSGYTSVCIEGNILTQHGNRDCTAKASPYPREPERLHCSTPVQLYLMH